MGGDASIRLSVAAGAALAAISALSELAEARPELRNDIVDLIEAGDQLFAIHIDGGAATGTDELTVRLEPSDRLRSFLAASGAGNFDLGVVEHDGRPIAR